MAEEEKEPNNNENEELLEKDAIKNLELSYNYLLDDYRQQISRLNSADQKMNMFFVFNAAIVALLTVVFSINNETNALYTLSVILLTLFAVSIIATVSTIALSLYPKGTIHLSNENFMEADYYYKPENEFISGIMGSINISINTLHNHIEMKMRCIKIVSVETILNIIIVFTLIFLRLF